MSAGGTASIGAVVIGRNEGDRLVRCLASLTGHVGRVVYVDSGSTDGSPAAAEAAGAEVLSLDLSRPFTAARARNAGLALLREAPPEFVQFVDGDCELQPDWITTASRFLTETPDAAIACGRRRERFPHDSLYNKLIDFEWDSPIGKALYCGGDAMMRMTALDQVGGFRDDLIAGEEPELCVRLRQKGWEIWRLDAEMTLHDAAMTRFSQWWTRSRRAGHAAAEGAALHGHLPERHGVAWTLRALGWGLVLPLAGLLLAPWGLLLWLAYPAQIARMVAKGDDPTRAAFTMLGKLPEMLGVLGYALGRLSHRRTRLIEYK